MSAPRPDDQEPAGQPLPALAGLGYLLKHAQLRLAAHGVSPGALRDHRAGVCGAHRH